MSNFRSLFNKIKKLPCRPRINEYEYSPFEQIKYSFNYWTAKEKFPQVANDINSLSNLKCLAFPQTASGLFVFPKILTQSACDKWLNYFMQVAPVECYDLFKSNVTLPPKNPDDLRWLTFGYHYNWDDKGYDEKNKNLIPDEIVKLLQCLAQLINLSDWQVETGIVNYYTCKSRLGPHIDGFEENKQAPLLSLSLGSDAIFIVENEIYGQKDSSILLQNGDLMVMSGKSRLLTHALAKVYCQTGSQACSRKKVIRINLNARQFSKDKVIK